MKHFWTTAAVIALCAIAADGVAAGAFAAPQGGQVLLVAEKQTTTTHKKKKKSKKTKKSAAKGHAAKGKKGRHKATAERSSGRHHRGPARASSEIHTAAPAPIKVGRHDTLTSISRKTGVSVEELARLNGLKKPYHVRLGERIKLPARRYYVVKSGETLYSLSRQFGVETAELAALNGMARGGHVKSGQHLYLPSGAADTEQPVETRPTPRLPPPRPYSPPLLPPPQPQPGETPQSSAPPASSGQGFELAPRGNVPAPSTAPGGRAIIQTNPAPSAADVASAGKGKFVWPTSGALINGFGPTSNGQRNDGVNISGNVGDPVRAAADGEVVYAGDQVPSFGNLVLVKHPGGWVTAYAHMSKILVKNRDQVVQGQEIGSVGQTGQVTAPQLHFEIRYAPSAKDKAVPIDPMLVLPGK